MINPLSNLSGKPVDWWFSYKLPRHIGPRKSTTGFEFLYMDSESLDGLKMQENTLDQNKSALAFTLRNLFETDSTSDYVMWNDEVPPTNGNPHPPNQGSKGHSKGVLAFCRKTKTGFYLLHSTPRFPTPGMIELPDYESSYGQVYMCVAINDFDTVDSIAKTLLTQNEVQVYDHRLSVNNTEEFLYKLAMGGDLDKAENPNCIKFQTPGGVDFHFMVKSKYWSKPTKDNPIGKDFWRDMVGPHLKCNLSVETWRRGMVFSDINKEKGDVTKDIVDVDLSKIGIKNINWTFTRDHSKWGISLKKDPGYIVISDINRQTSQSKRGGGGLGFKHPLLWEALNNIKVDESNIELSEHKDKA